MWDAMVDGEGDTLTPEIIANMRFAGIAHKVVRKMSESEAVVEIHFRDYTSLFLDMKPFPTAGLPKWGDTLQTIWERICDHVGYKDPTTNKIVSSVEALKPNLQFLIPELRGRSIGDIVNQRFHETSAPTVKTGSDAWGVWQWICASMGLISYISGTQCIVTDTTEHYQQDRAPAFLWGENILEIEETADNTVSNKGVLIKSFDPLKWRSMEAVYPKPGDDRLKVTRSVANRSNKEHRDPSINEISKDYEEFNAFWIQEQDALDRYAQFIYEQRSRQQIDGKMKTSEMWLTNRGGERIDTLSLSAADPIVVGIHADDKDILEKFAGSKAGAHNYLVNIRGYAPDLADLIIANLDAFQTQSPIFHTKTLEVTLTPDTFEIEIGYQNLIVTK